MLDILPDPNTYLAHLLLCEPHSLANTKAEEPNAFSKVN
jgi:hypothetical protein